MSITIRVPLQRINRSAKRHPSITPLTVSPHHQMADIEPQQTGHLLGGSFPRYIPRQRDSHAHSVGVSLYSRDVPPFASAHWHCLCIISFRSCLWTMTNLVANGSVYLLPPRMAPFQRKVHFKTRNISTWSIMTWEWENTDHCQM